MLPLIMAQRSSAFDATAKCMNPSPTVSLHTVAFWVGPRLAGAGDFTVRP